MEDGVVGEEGGVGGDAVVEGEPRAHVLGAQPAGNAAVLLGGLLDKLPDEHGRSIQVNQGQNNRDGPGSVARSCSRARSSSLFRNQEGMDR